MKLFLTALSMPALVLCGAVAISARGTYEAARMAVPLSPPDIPAALRVVPPPFGLDDVVRVLAHKHGVKQGYVKSIIAAESAFDQEAVSPRGAIGLMQLTPETARECGVDPNITEQNIEGGTVYLGRMLERYRKSPDHLRKAIAAYNAGPGNVDKYRGIPPFRETRAYVKRVMAYYREFNHTAKKDKTPWKSAHSKRRRDEDAD